VTDFGGYTSSQLQHVTVMGVGDDIATTIECRTDYLTVSCDMVALDKLDQINHLKLDWGDNTSEMPATLIAEQGIYQATHEYSNAGTYNVQLSVGTERGEVKNAETQVDVISSAPVAQISCYTNNLVVSCNAFGSYDPAGSSLSYSFDYGDNFISAPSAQGFFQHSYAVPGSYSVSITVRNNLDYRVRPRLKFKQRMRLQLLI